MANLQGKAGNVFVADLLLEDCEDAWNSGDNGTASLEATASLVMVGDGSALCVISGASADNVLMFETTATVKNVETYTHILCWARSTKTTAAADLRIGLGTTASGLSPTSLVDLPALTASVWLYCHCPEVAGSTLDDTSAGTIIGLEMHANAQDMSVHLDDIRAAKNIAGIKSWTLDYTVDTIDSTDFSDGAGTNAPRTFLPGLSSWSGTFEGFKDGAPLGIFTQIGLELAESATQTQAWRGNAILTGVHPTVNVDGLVAYTYDFQGTGELIEATA